MKKSLVPILVALAVVVGIWIGSLYAEHAQNSVASSNYGNADLISSNKISDVLNLIQTSYVDTVYADSISEAIIPLIIKQLDPHSAYIPAADLEAVNEQLEGSFSGIGVQFSLQEDTIYVVDVISGGPSERAGLMDGDRIVEVDDTLFVGKQINNEKVMKKLRGPKGSHVRLGIVRRSAPEMLHFDITRGDIPVHSVDVAYMITPKIGFVSVNKFGATTYHEFLTALAQLKQSKVEKIIVDLRGNAGGYMDAALNMLNEFLSSGDLLVYVEGKAYPRTDSHANGYGSCQQMDLAVLIDEWSGSASEIFAGAVQDNDRGVIIGRRSFGKGLVQNQMELADGSALRLTVARYYTPSGRSIQKPYVRGQAEDYETDLLNRYLHGEFFSQDSIRQNDTVKFYTRGGREVHGGGGIMPDIFVPRDTLGVSNYFNDLVNGAHIYRFALNYSDTHRDELAQYRTGEALEAYLNSHDLFAQLVADAAKHGVKGSAKDKSVSHDLIMQHLTSYIIRNVLGDTDFYRYINRFDKTVQRAVEELEQ